MNSLSLINHVCGDTGGGSLLFYFSFVSDIPCLLQNPFLCWIYNVAIFQYSCILSLPSGATHVWELGTWSFLMNILIRHRAKRPWQTLEMLDGVAHQEDDNYRWSLLMLLARSDSSSPCSRKCLSLCCSSPRNLSFLLRNMHAKLGNVLINPICSTDSVFLCWCWDENLWSYLGSKMSLRVRPWLPYGVQLPIPWTHHLSHFQSAHTFSCSLIQVPLLICAGVHCDHILWWSVVPVNILHKGDMPSTWNGFAEGFLPGLAVWQLKTLQRSAVHAIDIAQLELWNSTWFYVHRTNFQVHVKIVTFCVSGIHTSFVQRRESWAWNHNLLFGGT